MATWDINSIKKFIEEESKCILKSTNYKNVREKLHLVCSCGNEFHTPFTKFKDYNKRTCNECSEKVRRKNFLQYPIKKLLNL